MNQADKSVLAFVADLHRLGITTLDSSGLAFELRETGDGFALDSDKVDSLIERMIPLGYQLDEPGAEMGEQPNRYLTHPKHQGVLLELEELEGEITVLLRIIADAKPLAAPCGPYAPGKVEDIKLGEFVRRKPDATKTYKRGAYDRSSKRYSLIDCDDTNREIFVKRGTILFIGFTY